MHKHFLKRSPSVWKGVVSGAAAGLAATIVMSQFQNAWSKAAEALKDKQREDNTESSAEKEDATMKAAGKLAKTVGHPLSHQEKKKAGPFIHYGFGTAMGTVYGLMKETAPEVLHDVDPLFSGTAFGTAVFAGGDEFAVPALGLSRKPLESPASEHAYGLISHLIYGVTLGAVQQIIRKRF
jgi:putative membrane protein